MLSRIHYPRWFFAPVLGLLALGCGLLVGCGGPKVEPLGAVVPVAGKVTVNGKVLPAGMVSFNPDESKGNTSKNIPTASLEADGSYKLVTGTVDGVKEGAPPGWYKVTIMPIAASDPAQSAASAKAPSIGTPYQGVMMTPLLVEVKDGAAAGAYDLKLK